MGGVWHSRALFLYSWMFQPWHVENYVSLQHNYAIPWDFTVTCKTRITVAQCSSTTHATSSLVFNTYLFRIRLYELEYSFAVKMEQTVKSDWDTDKMSLSLHQDVRCRLLHLISLEKCHIVPDAWPATRPEAITNMEWPFRRAFRGFKWQIRFQSVYYFLLCTMFCTASTQDFFFMLVWKLLHSWVVCIYWIFFSICMQFNYFIL